MISRVATYLSAKRVAVLALLVVLALAAGYVSNLGAGAPARASVDPLPSGASGACGRNRARSAQPGDAARLRRGRLQRTHRIAMRSIKGSHALREAVEQGDAAAARAAARALLASGHLTNLTVISAGADARRRRRPRGARAAARLDPQRQGRSDRQLRDERLGGRRLPLRAEGRRRGRCRPARGRPQLAGSFALPAGELPPAGTLTEHGTVFQYDSFPASVYPSGSLRVYLLRSVNSTARICGATPQDTLVNTLGRVAALIYAGEGGPHALLQVHRAQQDSALLEAVAARDPVAARQAVVGLVYDHSHIVRLRVSAGAHLLADVGGPYVLAPVQRAAAPARQADRRTYALDPGRRRLPAPRPAPGRPRRADVHEPHRRTSRTGQEQPRPRGGRALIRARERHLPLPRAYLPRVHARTRARFPRARCRSGC